jgi:vacuolar-type H+-ATPase subunit H
MIVAGGQRGHEMPRLHTDETGAATATGVAATIERVLAAERDAATDVERARVRCAERVAEARLEARRILERAEGVAQAIHARTERVAASRAAESARAVAPHVAGAEEADAIVARVAAVLTDDADD